MTKEISILLKNILETNQEILKALKGQVQQSPIKKITLTDFYKKYVSTHKGQLSDSTLTILQYGIKHLNEFLDREINLDEITKEIILEFRNYLSERAKSGVYWRGLKSFFNTGIELGYLSINPFNTVKPKKIQHVKKDVINYEQLGIILQNIINPSIKSLVEFTYLTGLRLGEVINIRLSDIDFKEKLLTVGSDTFITKSRKQRIIPLTEKAHKIALNSFPQNINIDKSNYLFCKNDGSPYSKDYISKTFKKSMLKSRLQIDVSFHSLRHSFSTNLAQSGTPINTVKELLGHANVRTTEIYFNHENIKSLRDGINKTNYN